jgi:hypothetical protein
VNCDALIAHVQRRDPQGIILKDFQTVENKKVPDDGGTTQ